MPQVIDIQREMDARTFLEGRHVDTAPEELEAAYHEWAERCNVVPWETL